MQKYDRKADGFFRPAGVALSHKVIEVFGASYDLLADENALSSKLSAIMDALGLNVRQVCTYTFVPGVTAVAVLSQSHAALHTWPEYGYAHIDVVSCTDGIEWSTLVDRVRAEFAPGHVIYHGSLEY